MILTPLVSVRARLDSMYQTADECRKAHLLNIANNSAKVWNVLVVGRWRGVAAGKKKGHALACKIVSATS